MSFFLILLAAGIAAAVMTQRRHPVIQRLHGPALRYLAPAWFLVAAATAAALYSAVAGHRGTVLNFGLDAAMRLIAAQFLLVGGSLWAWKAGLRHKRFGWGLRGHRREILPLGPLAVYALAINLITITLLAVASSAGISIAVHEDLASHLENQPMGGPALFALLAMQILIAPFLEEILFRHFLQNGLEVALGGARWAGVAAIVLISALWAFGHGGMLRPEWLKFLQIFLAGMLLGGVQRRWGVSMAIATHLALNVGVMIVPLISLGGW